MQAFEKAPPDVQEILAKPIKELGLKLEGSPLERFVQQLYRELERSISPTRTSPGSRRR